METDDATSAANAIRVDGAGTVRVLSVAGEVVLELVDAQLDGLSAASLAAKVVDATGKPAQEVALLSDGDVLREKVLQDFLARGDHEAVLEVQLVSQEAMIELEGSAAMSQLPLLLRMISSSVGSHRLEAVTKIRKLLSLADCSPINEVVDAGFVPPLVGLCLDCDDQLKREAGWALLNILSGTTEQVQSVVKQGAVPIFAEMLGSLNDDIQDQAVWALGNVAGDSPEHRDLVLQAGVMDNLLRIVGKDNQRLSILRSATWALGNLCRGSPPPPWETISPAAEVLSHLVGNVTDDEVLTDALWGLCRLVGPEGEHVDILEADLITRLISRDAMPNVNDAAMAVARKIAIQGGEAQKQALMVIVQTDRLLWQLLDDQKERLRLKACRVIEGLVEGSPERIQAVIDSGLIQVLVGMLDEPAPIRTEAAGALLKALQGVGSRDQVAQLEKLGVASQVAVDGGAAASATGLPGAGKVRVLSDAGEVVLELVDGQLNGLSAASLAAKVVDATGKLAEEVALLSDGDVLRDRVLRDFLARGDRAAVLEVQLVNQAALMELEGPGISQLPVLIEMINSTIGGQRIEAVTTIRKLLSVAKSPPISEVVDAGFVPPLVELCLDTDEQMKLEAGWALLNILSGTTEHVQAVVKHGALPIFAEMLASSNDDIQDQAVWALGNVAGDSPEHRDLVLQAGVLDNMLRIVAQENQRLTILRSATWALSNLCGGSPPPSWEVISPAAEVLSHLVGNVTDNEVLTDALAGLCRLAGPHGEHADILEADLIVRLISRDAEPTVNDDVIDSAMAAAKKIAIQGGEAQKQALMGIMQTDRLLWQLLHVPNKQIRQKACRVIDGLVEGSPERIQSVMDSGLIQVLVGMLDEGSSLQAEAAEALRKALQGVGSQDQLAELQKLGVAGRESAEKGDEMEQ